MTTLENGMNVSQEDLNMRKMFKYVRPGEHNLRNYNDFIRSGIPSLVEGFSLGMGDDNFLVFRNTRVGKPTITKKNVARPLYPQLAREMGLTYGASVTTDAVIVRLQEDGSPLTVSTENVNIGTIPVMLRSDVCNLKGLSADEVAGVGEDPNDICGYFIVDGKEFVVLMQEMLALNRIFLIQMPNDAPVARMTVISPDKSTSISVVAQSKTGDNLRYRFPSLGKFKQKTKNASFRSINIMYLFFWLGIGGEKMTDIYNDVMESFPEEERPVRKMAMTVEEFRDHPVYRQAVKNFSIEAVVSLIAKFIPEEQFNKCLLQLGPTINEFHEHFDPVKVFLLKIAGDEKKATITSLLNTINELFSVDFYVHCNELPMLNDETIEEHAQRTIEMKAELLACMTANLLSLKAGFRKLDDRDSWSNKRLMDAGKLMENLFRSAWKKTLKELMDHLSTKGRKVNNITILQRKLMNTHITGSFRDSFVTSNWGVKGSHIRANIAQILSRDSRQAAIAHISTIDVKVARVEKGQQMRLIQGSQFGFVDPVYTPEGENAGLLKVLAMFARTSTDVDDTVILRRLMGDEELQMEPLLNVDGGNSTVLMNGRILGRADGQMLRDTLIDYRRRGEIPGDTTIVHVAPFVYIETTSNRVMRPIFLLDADGVTPLYEKFGLVDATPEDWLARGVMEYVSPWEQEYLDIATTREDILNRMQKKQGWEVDLASEDPGVVERAQKELAKLKLYTHVEITPLSMLSYGAACIPWPDHNQAPRNTYQYGMGKQALTHAASHSMRSIDAKAKILLGAQAPLVTTATFDFLGLGKEGAGENIYVSFMALPYTEEDSFVIKKEYLERGGMMYTHEFIIKEVIKHTDSPPESLWAPPLAEGYIERYRNIYRGEPDANGVIHEKLRGLPLEGSLVEDHDCIIGKCQYVKNARGVREIVKTSKFLSYGERGIVDKVFVNEDDATTTTIIVKIRSVRIPQPGDKFAARNAQKGTAGLIVSERFLPFDERGISPDLFTNPHSIPSRMTLSYPLEIVASTYAAFSGRIVNGEAFTPLDLVNQNKEIKEYGYESYCDNRMRSGGSGILMPGKIFGGMCYIQELKHHAEDKEQSRDTGRVTADVRQPVKSRTNIGGLRFGEMERDALISHGAAFVLLERLMQCSDPYPAAFCRQCGEFAINSPDTDWFLPCVKCGNEKDFCRKTIPYSWKYLKDLLAAMSMNIRPVFENGEQAGEHILHELQADEQGEENEEEEFNADENADHDEGDYDAGDDFGDDEGNYLENGFD